MPRDRAQALLIDLDGVLRRWDPAPMIAVEVGHGLKPAALLEIYEELRDNSQLVVITHQKRTMEVADALYGVSMRGDGVSAVISQRLREEESA